MTMYLVRVGSSIFLGGESEFRKARKAICKQANRKKEENKKELLTEVRKALKR